MIKEIIKQTNGHYLFEVTSSKGDKTYAVEAYYVPSSGKWYSFCSCKGFLFKSECKHMKFVDDYANHNLTPPDDAKNILVADKEKKWLVCPKCGTGTFAIKIRDWTTPYRGENIKVKCSNCSSEYEVTGTEGLI